MENKERVLGYQMSKACFNNIVKGRSGEDKKMNPYQYALKIINEQYGLKGKVNFLSVV